MQARPFYFWCWNRIFLFFYVYILQLKTINNSYNLLKIVRTQSKVEKFSHFKSVNVLSHAETSKKVKIASKKISV